MAKVTLPPITSGLQTQTQINANFTAIADELNNKVLYRDNPVGEPNPLEDSIDANSNNIVNVNNLTTSALSIAGQSVVAGDTLTVPSAVNVPNVPAGNIVAIDVQAAINELDSEKVHKASNLSDVADVPTARTNLGLGSVAVLDTGTLSTEVPTNANLGSASLLDAATLPRLDAANVFTEIQTAPDFTATSDARVKSDVVEIQNALNTVKALTGVYYTLEDGKRRMGFIAQDILPHTPELVNGGPTEETPDALYSVSYGNSVALLVEAIKELDRKLDEVINGN